MKMKMKKLEVSVFAIDGKSDFLFVIFTCYYWVNEILICSEYYILISFNEIGGLHIYDVLLQTQISLFVLL